MHRFVEIIYCYHVLLCLTTVPGEPQKVKLQPINSTTVTVSWQPPPDADLNGILKGYQLRYFAVNETGDPLSAPEHINLTLYRSELNLTGLQPNTLYVIQVAAYTQPGLGEFSKPKRIRTKGSGRQMKLRLVQLQCNVYPGCSRQL